VYPYLYEVKLLVNEIDLLADDFHLLVQQEFICIEIESNVLGFVGILVTIGSPHFPYPYWDDLGCHLSN
jgi:hypothetical protein